MGHARALISIHDPVRQLELYHRIVESQLSVRQVEQMARTTPTAAKRNGTFAPRANKELGRKLADRFGSRVVVKQDPQGKGKREIAIRDDDELKRIMAWLG